MIATTRLIQRLVCWLTLSMLLCVGNAAAAVSALPGIPGLPDEESTLQVTWYGVTTLLFDDGDTQVLIDGFFSRPKLVLPDSPSAADGLLSAMAEPDVLQIESMISSAGLHRLAAIVPVHSHFDHAMDLGVISKLTGAAVIGSESTANVARGAGVPESHIKVITDRGEFRFGEFAITLILSNHAPIQDGGPPIPGTIDEPLVPPAAIGDWKEGASYSVVVTHPSGTVLVQGSAGYRQGSLSGIQADTVFLGIGGLEALGPEHADNYFRQVVELTGPACVIPIHWDDFVTAPFGQSIFMGDSATLDWLKTQTHQRNMGLAAPVFGVPINPFTSACRSL